MHISDSQQAAT